MSIIKTVGAELLATETPKLKYRLAVFAVYLTLLTIVVFNHEPWMDEAQAWLLAKDTTVGELFIKYLRYEGSPGLWHLLLMIPAKLGLPYFSINILSAFFSSLGVWLFLAYSPFPLVIRVLFPFTYFAFFQYGVVARSYCLIPLVLFLAAIIYPKKNEQPLVYTILLCLLANISTHTLLIAFALFFLHFFEAALSWKTITKSQKQQQAVSVLIFGLMCGILSLIILPPPDHLLAGYSNWSPSNFISVSKWMISGALIVDESSPLIWIELVISLMIFAATVIWLQKNKLAFLYLLPLLPVLALFAIKYRNFWHQGILFFLWVFVLWVSFEKVRHNKPLFFQKTVLSLITIVFAVQIYWAARAAHFDVFYNYSGSFAVAEYIQNNQLEEQKIFISGWKAIAILPYFDDNIFYNHNHGTKPRFWFWSTELNQTVAGASPQVIDLIVSQQPDIAIFASDHLESTDNILIPGYEMEKIFHGSLCWKTGINELDTYWLFRRNK